MPTDTDTTQRGHDVYDVVIPTERELVVDVTAEGSTKAKVKAKAEAEYAADEILRGTGRAWQKTDEDDGYAVVVKVGRELEYTVEAPHPQKARTEAKYGVEYKDGEVIAARPQVSRSAGDQHVNGE